MNSLHNNGGGQTETPLHKWAWGRYMGSGEGRKLLFQTSWVLEQAEAGSGFWPRQRCGSGRPHRIATCWAIDASAICSLRQTVSDLQRCQKQPAAGFDAFQASSSAFRPVFLQRTFVYRLWAPCPSVGSLHTCTFKLTQSYSHLHAMNGTDLLAAVLAWLAVLLGSGQAHESPGDERPGSTVG